MAANPGILTPETFDFFRGLERNNNKPWMDANRERYRESVVEPFRQLLERLAPHALKLDSGILITGRTNENFSRINRDIRFARDKTPYRPHYYLFLRTHDAIEHGGPQFYLGVTKDGATAGFRNYSEDRASALAQYGVPRGQSQRAWLARQKNRLGRKFDSYWYSSEKKDWLKHTGWPLEPDEWKKLQAWVVRRRFSKAAAVRPNFTDEIAKVFRDVFPLYAFTGSASWKP
ncbi:MAG: DUF2461 family protein [Candidatus Acidiferrales bacterium]